jgi:hypothetical protein
MRSIRIGCGAGYAGDRIEPAIELAEHGRLHYLLFECLAERTIALAQQAKAKDPQAGYDPMLIDRMRAVLPTCMVRGVRVITNMGAANPPAAADAICRLARELGLKGMMVATVTGDDVLDVIREGEGGRDSEYVVMETGEPVARLAPSLVSANAYLGADAVLAALDTGADVIVTGRVADASMFLAAQIHELGWAIDDWDLLGAGTLVGHLLECAGQVTGGYFADPGVKDVRGLARLGFPIAEVDEDGTAVITKVEGSGGAVTAATCKEQLLYEIHDPGAYLTPDVIADFTDVRVDEIAPDRVRVDSARGRPRPERLKVSIGYHDGFIGEAQISYAGPGAVARAELAKAIVAERIRLTDLPVREIRYDLIGVDALHGSRQSHERCEPYEVRLRVAARTDTKVAADKIGHEVEALYTNGPAAGGGVMRATRDVLALVSTLMPRGRVSVRIACQEV